MLNKDNVQDIYGLSPMQQGMLLQFAIDPVSTAYVEQFDFCMEGEINLNALQKSLYMLVNKYAALRTIFSFRKTDLPNQIVLKTRDVQKVQIFHASYLDLSEDAAAQVENFKLQDRKKGFNLSLDVLLRISLLSLASDRHHLVFSFHHIILDGWCMGILLGDFFGYYERFCLDPDLHIEDREVYPYRDYIRWIAQQDKRQAQEYWKTYLEGYQTEVGVPYFDLKPEAAAAAGVSSESLEPDADYEFSLGKDLTARLTVIAKDAQITINSIFQTAWGILLQKYNNTDDVVFGCVISGRPPNLAGVEQMIGLFLNTQPVRVACNPDEELIAVAKRVHQSLFQSIAYDFYPLSAIQSASPLKNRLFNHIVTFENFPISEQVLLLNANSKELRVSGVRVFQAAKFDFHVIVNPGEDLRINFVHNPRRYSQVVITSIARSLLQLLHAIAAAPEQQVQRLSICSASDTQKIIQKFNATARDYPSQQSVTGLFLQSVQDFPDVVALRYREHSYTYRQLHAEALIHATCLRELGVQDGDNVAILTRRSAAMVIGVLAIYYCGASYTPIEAGISNDRLRFILEDCAARILCTVESLRDLAPLGVQLHLLDHTPDVRSSLQPVLSAPTQTAYVMYTSGSTGQPKGCRITHRNIVRLVRNTNFLKFGSQHRILQTCSNAFDGTTLEFWGALLNGGQLCVIDEERILDPKLLRAAIEEYQITIMWLTAALFNQLCDADADMFRPLQYLLVGGDVLSPRHIEKARLANPNLKLINGYGPTENTTFSTTFDVDRAYPDGVPIGKPIANSSAYILDAAGNLLPPGAFGELCVGGDGVANGYVNRPELNAEKFVADPFCDRHRPDARLYRTGDIARWLPDGNIDLLGRNDFQVKLRGFRVELGEIERTLCTLDGISESVVIAHESLGGKQLHAFYVCQQVIAAVDLRNALSALLPSYMVPTFYLRMERLPLTVNGKLDRRALPIEESFAQRANAVVVEPKSVTELRIADVFKQVLGLEEIGIYDNFFDIGANSLNLIAINHRLKDLFSQDISITAMFEYTSVARLAEYLDTDSVANEAKLARETQELDQARNTLLKTRKLLRPLEVE